MDLYFTFDYELFLGPETGSVNNCLIIPCKKLAEIAKKHNVKFVFFVDVLYLLKLRDYINDSVSARKDFDAVYQQLQSLSFSGHDLELHLHPQWYYSTYKVKESKWEMDYLHYRLDDCSLDDVRSMVSQGILFLKEITGKYPIAYRAGGYCFPCNREIQDLLSKSGIIFDSSVLLNECCTSEFQSYDYSSVHVNSPYSFKDDNIVSVSSSESVFTEYPISTFKYYSLHRSLLERIDKWSGNRMGGGKIYGDGKGVGYLKEKKSENIPFFARIIRKEYIRASTDGFRSFFLSRLYAKVKQKNKSYLMIIGHPKNQSDYSLNQINDFLERMDSSDRVLTFLD